MNVRLIATLAAFAMTACSDPAGPAERSDPLVGTYRLATVNGAQPPQEYRNNMGMAVADSGSLHLKGDGSFDLMLSVTQKGTTDVDRWHGTYEVISEGALAMEFSTGASQVFERRGSDIVWSHPGLLLTYRR